jgi:hypothetical protein
MAFHNASRGLRIDGSNFIYLTEGAYGIIFVDRDQKRIRKVARRQDGRAEAHTKEVFGAETEAYKIASCCEELTALVPAYFGSIQGLKIVDGEGKDVSSEFYPDIAFEAEFVDGFFQKIATVPASESRRICDFFRKRGIFHMSDSCVCLKDAKIMKVIDFATKEFEVFESPKACGRPSDAAK